MSKKVIVQLFNSAIDRNGNTYWAADFIDPISFTSAVFQVSTGSNAEMIAFNLAGKDWEKCGKVRGVEMKIREFNRFTKGMPYLNDATVQMAIDQIKDTWAAKQINITQWAITHDLIGDKHAENPSNLNALGMVGPRTATLTYAEICKHPARKMFKLYDDDKNLYYEGYLIGPNLLAPLDDFGTPNSGCTIIKVQTDPAGDFVIV